MNEDIIVNILLNVEYFDINKNYTKREKYPGKIYEYYFEIKPPQIFTFIKKYKSIIFMLDFSNFFKKMNKREMLDAQSYTEEDEI